MTDINLTNTNLNIPEYVQRQRLPESDLPSFLNITGVVGNRAVSGIVRRSFNDVPEDIERQIGNIEYETDVINSVLNENATTTELQFGANFSGKLFSPKKINFVEYNSQIPETSNTISVISSNMTNNHVVQERTNVNKLLASLHYSDNFNTDTQRVILMGAVQKLADWLDSYIVHYKNNVRNGSMSADSEVKLSFLLKLRKQIENCDFPVGFGNDEGFQAEMSRGNMILGSYDHDYYVDTYLNPTDNAHDNNAVTNHFNRSIILNAAVFMPERKFSCEEEAREAMNDYVNNPNGRLDFDIYDVMMSSDDFYYNYVQTYVASVLAHELTHAMHYANEAIAYNTCEMLEDDMRHMRVYSGWSEDTQNAVDAVDAVNEVNEVNGRPTNFDCNLNTVTYGDVMLRINDDYGVAFHNLEKVRGAFSAYSTMENVLDFGWQENGRYFNYGYNSDGTPKRYRDYSSGNTRGDVLRELLNFVVDA